MCVDLLHTLAAWLTDRRCPHYFISNCNLIDDTLKANRAANQLTTITEAHLATWFVDNYIRKCSERCPSNVSRLFDDISTRMKLENAVSAVVDWRTSSCTELHDLWSRLESAELQIQNIANKESLNVRSCGYLRTKLAKLDERLFLYFMAIAFLDMASKLHNNGMSYELMDVLVTTLGMSVDHKRASRQYSSVASLNTAAKLMKNVANKPHSTVQLIEIELSKAFLYRALRCKDSDSDSIYCLANVYLAVLYYTTGQYQTAIDHCTLVTRSQDHSQCSSHVVQGELLPKTGDDIDNVLGLAVFYQHVRTAALNQEQDTRYVSVYTTEVFAHFLFTVCLSDTGCRLVEETPSNGYYFSSYIKHVHMEELFLTDLLLLKAIKKTCFEYPCNILYKSVMLEFPSATTIPNEINILELVELLQRSAVEHLTTYRQLMVRDFGSIVTIVTTDFEALYAYKHGDYQRCLQLSTQNVHTLLYAVPMFSIVTLPVFTELMDDDIVSVIKCRGWSLDFTITQLTLSLYLMTQCQLKLCHSMTSLFQTLDYIKVAQRMLSPCHRLDQLTLELIVDKILCLFMETVLYC